MTGNDVITEALLLHGIIYYNQSLPTQLQDTAEITFNNMLSEWNAQGLAVFSVVKETFTLTSGVGDYEIGPDASSPWDVARPEKIEAWAAYDSSGASNGGKPVDSATFARMADDRSLTAARVEMLNYDAAYPDATIHLYPKPNGGTLELWVWEQFSQITDFTQTLNFAPGYLQAVCYNLSCLLAPKFGKEISPSVQKIADETKAALGATNISEMTRIPPENRPAPPQPQRPAQPQQG